MCKLYIFFMYKKTLFNLNIKTKKKYILYVEFCNMLQIKFINCIINRMIICLYYLKSMSLQKRY